MDLEEEIEMMLQRIYEIREKIILTDKKDPNYDQIIFDLKKELKDTKRKTAKLKILLVNQKQGGKER